MHGSGWRSGAALRINEVDIHLLIEEPARNGQRALTKQELEMHRRFPAFYPKAVTYDSKPTGRLILRMDEWQVEDIQRSWSDGKNRRLEALIREIVETILVTAVEKKDRLATEAEERRREEEAERRRQAEQERRRDEQQSEFGPSSARRAVGSSARLSIVMSMQRSEQTLSRPAPLKVNLCRPGSLGHESRQAILILSREQFGDSPLRRRHWTKGMSMD